jgi:short-subunit dehydrogenase
VSQATSASSAWRAKYGPWALVAGASEGLGAAFAHACARRGLDVLLLARRAGPLHELATALAATHGVRAEAHAIDLGAPGLELALDALLASREVGLGIYNAALSLEGPFLSQPLADKLRAVDVNVRGPLVFADRLGRPMAERGRGGLLLVSSLASLQGAALLATYAATKAFDRVLAEGLWSELGAHGIDVMTTLAGATDTPNLHRSRPARLPGLMRPEAVAEASLEALGGGPSFVPGALNRLGALVLGRLLSRKQAIGVLAQNTRRMYGGR